MALTIDWATKVVTVPQAYLTPVTGSLYELDTDQFRLDLKAIEASEDGVVFPDTHQHNTAVTVAGTTFARTIEMINGYSVEFEDLVYSVRLAGSNNNIFDVENGILVQNQVQVIAQNSSGLVEPSEKYPKGSIVSDSENSKIQFKTDLPSTYHNFYTFAYLKFTSGECKDQLRDIKAYDGTTKIITTSEFYTVPSSGDKFKIINQ